MKKQLKKNKALFLLPLALLPFVVLIFYVLGGGSGADKGRSAAYQNAGANYVLPEAEKSLEIFDKMEAYQKEGIPGTEAQPPSPGDSVPDRSELSPDTTKQREDLLSGHRTPEDLLAHIRQREGQIKQELSLGKDSRRRVPLTSVRRQISSSRSRDSGTVKTEPQSTITTEIEELKRIVDQNTALSRINDSLKLSLQQAQEKLQHPVPASGGVNTLEKAGGSVFSRDDSPGKMQVRAEIYEGATVRDGNRVKLRLLEETSVGGYKVPENTFVYGICRIKNERLYITVSQLAVAGTFVPVKLTVCDLDGMEGLYVPDNAARKVYQEVGASANTSSMLGVSSDPLAYAGIRAADRAAQTVIKSVRIKKVKVKQNTLVYITNQN